MSTRFIYTQVTRRLESGPHSIASVKQASVLFDEVLFERRFGVNEDVPWDEVSGRYNIPEETVTKYRAEHPRDEFGRFIRWVDAEEKAALEARGVSLIEDANTSEFFGDEPEAPPLGHGAFNNLPLILRAKGCDWIQDVVVAPDKLPQIPRISGDGSWRREARAIAEVHRATLYGGFGAKGPLGSPALALLVPDLVHLPWEAIAEFRAHPGSHEARHRLRDFDAKAQAQELEVGEIGQFEQRVGAEITGSLLAAWVDTRPRLGRDVAKEAAKTGIGFIPLVGPAVSAGVSIAESTLRRREHDRSWLSALWNLIGRADAEP
jgi:hypothetical protein